MSRRLIVQSLVALGLRIVLSLLIVGLGSESVFSHSVSVAGPINGTWKVTVDRPTGFLQGEKPLLGIAAIAEDNIWGVGVEHGALASARATSDRALIIHWTGTKWEK